MAPVMLLVYTKQRAGVFSFQQLMPPGIKPPQHCASPGNPACRRYYCNQPFNSPSPPYFQNSARATNTKKAAEFSPAARFGRMLPLRRTNARQLTLFPVTPPAQNRAGDNSHRNRCCQIVPEKHAKLCERHVAALVAIATVRGYPLFASQRMAPVMLLVYTKQRAGVFSFQQLMPPGIKPPQHCASPEFRLGDDTTAISPSTRRHHLIFRIAPGLQEQKSRRVLSLRLCYLG